MILLGSLEYAKGFDYFETWFFQLQVNYQILDSEHFSSLWVYLEKLFMNMSLLKFKQTISLQISEQLGPAQLLECCFYPRQMSQ